MNTRKLFRDVVMILGWYEVPKQQQPILQYHDLEVKRWQARGRIGAHITSWKKWKSTVLYNLGKQRSAFETMFCKKVCNNYCVFGQALWRWPSVVQVQTFSRHSHTDGCEGNGKDMPLVLNRSNTLSHKCLLFHEGIHCQPLMSIVLHSGDFWRLSSNASMAAALSGWNHVLRFDQTHPRYSMRLKPLR